MSVEGHVCSTEYEFFRGKRERERERERAACLSGNYIIKIFTDGSKAGEKVGAAAVIFQRDNLIQEINAN